MTNNEVFEGKVQSYDVNCPVSLCSLLRYRNTFAVTFPEGTIRVSVYLHVTNTAIADGDSYRKVR